MTKSKRRKYAAEWARKNYWKHPVISRRKQNAYNRTRSKKRAVYCKEWRTKNRAKVLAYGRKHAAKFRLEHPRKHYDSVLRSKYGVSLTGYYKLQRSQGGRCAICKSRGSCIRNKKWKRRWKRLAIDHCHDTGKIRALLCDPCNNGLGCFRDDPAILKKALQYLLAHS